jgi:NADPH-ferrihemoprotein reductase
VIVFLLCNLQIMRYLLSTFVPALISVAGVGEPPDNGREFYEYIMDKPSNLDGLEYAVFGLGSTAGHAAYFNVIGKSLDKRLEELGASRVMEIGLGDDGDCIEDDFDNWMEKFVDLLKEKSSDEVENENVGVEEVIDNTVGTMDLSQQTEQLESHDTHYNSDSPSTEDRLEEFRAKCEGVALRGDGTRMISKKFPTLQLLPPRAEFVRKHLFHLNQTPNQFYTNKTVSLSVIGNKLLGIDAGESGIHELKLSTPNVEYETGDHLVVYPQNSQCIVDAYLDLLDVDRHAIIAEEGQPSSYPFPKVCQNAFKTDCWEGHFALHSTL